MSQTKTKQAGFSFQLNRKPRNGELLSFNENGQAQIVNSIDIVNNVLHNKKDKKLPKSVKTSNADSFLDVSGVHSQRGFKSYISNEHKAKYDNEVIENSISIISSDIGNQILAQSKSGHIFQIGSISGPLHFLAQKEGFHWFVKDKNVFSIKDDIAWFGGSDIQTKIPFQPKPVENNLGVVENPQLCAVFSGATVFANPGYVVSESQPLTLDRNTGRLVTVNSSKEFKDNMTNISETQDSQVINVDQFFDDLNVKTYYDKRDTSSIRYLHYGLSAEDVVEKYPTLGIYQENDKKLIGLKYGIIHILALEKIKRQQQQIDSQQQLIDSQQQQINALEQLIQSQQQQIDSLQIPSSPDLSSIISRITLLEQQLRVD